MSGNWAFPALSMEGQEGAGASSLASSPALVSVFHQSMMVLNAVVNLGENFAFNPDEPGLRSGTNDLPLIDETVAEHDANVLEGRTRIIFLGHAIDRGFFQLFAVNEIDDEDFFMACDAMCVDPERFPAILKFSYHCPPPLLGR
jgi:hypothetical protein